MLQQTRVDTVIEYYRRFMTRFPTLAALAQADHDTVLKHWEGLGYYRRAMHLHRAAKQVVFEFGGVMPDSAAGLRTLPGFGAYTSAAVASIAFGEAAAAVDGNVARVIARLFSVEHDVLSSAGRAAIQTLADALVDRRRPGDFNQAWMDLGSAVCTPRTPNCPKCTLRAHCAAAAEDRAEQLPVRSRPRAPRKVTCAAAIISRGRDVLVRQRPTGGLWSGLFEFPTVERIAGESAANALTRLLNECRLPGETAAPRRLGHIDHQLTHRTMRFEVFGVRLLRVGRSAATAPMRWATSDDLAALSLSTAHRRIQRLAESVGALGGGEDAGAGPTRLRKPRSRRG